MMGARSLPPSCVLAVCLVLSLTPGSVAEPTALVISEIMFNPDGDENAREFVEILNLSGAPASIEGCRIGDGEAFDPIAPAVGSDWTVPDGGYAVIFDPDYFASGEPYSGVPPNIALFTVTDKAIGLRGLSNSSPETVYLLSARGDTLSTVRYSVECPPGHSWERVLPRGGDGMENFRPSLEKEGTPGRRNSVTPPDRNPALGSDSIRFDPSALRMGGGLELSVSCRNGGLEPLADVSVTVTLLPDLPLGAVTFGEEIPPGGRSGERTLIIQSLRGGCLTIRAVVIEDGGSLYAADDTAYVRMDVPVPDGALILSEIMAAPREGPEWVEIMNTVTAPVSIYGWRIGDASGARSGEVAGDCFVSLGGFAVAAGGGVSFDVPGDAALVIPGAFPPLNNDGDTVLLIDSTGAVRDSVAYTGTTQGVSIELISPRLRGGVHAWDRCVDSEGSTPGRMNSIRFGRAEDGAASSGTGFAITPNPFGDTVVISYDLPFPLARVRLEVYDRRGRRVAVLREAAESGSSWSTKWDGCSGGKRLPAGAYILSFEALDKLTGEVVTIRRPLVIARKL